MKSFQSTATIRFADETFELSGTFTPALAGRFSGPPESCYPDEPAEFAIDTVTWIAPSGARVELPESLLEALSFDKDLLLENFERLALEEIERSREEDAADAAFERRRDKELGL